MAVLKQCNKCKLTKSSDCFFKHKNGKYGLDGRCKICKYNSRNKEQLNEYLKEYRIKNKDRIKLILKKSKAKNRHKILEYERKRRKEDINFRLAYNLRRRLNRALNRNTKNGSAIKDLGCSIEELKIHLETQFTKEMTWNNYGTVWEIDHILPLSKFDLTIIDNIKKLCNYNNLRPLLINENRKKSNNMNFNNYSIYINRF